MAIRAYFISFDASDDEVEELLKDHGLRGTLISNFTRRYAVDIPLAREKETLESLQTSGMIRRIMEGNVIEPRKRRKVNDGNLELSGNQNNRNGPKPHKYGD